MTARERGRVVVYVVQWWSKDRKAWLAAAAHVSRGAAWRHMRTWRALAAEGNSGERFRVVPYLPEERG